MLRKFWYPLFFSEDLTPDRPHAVTLFGEPLVCFRDKFGVPHALSDRCSHRSVPLSLGRICDGKIECMYHGWQFGAGGRCEYIPTHELNEKIPEKAHVPIFPTVERDGLIWVWAEKTTADYSAIPSYPERVSSDFIVVSGSMDLDIDYSLLIENLVDPTHVPFVHRATLAKPDKAQPLKYEVQAMPDGGFKGVFGSTRTPPLPLPDFFAFEPPCHVRVGRNDGSISRLFHCVPTAKGQARFMWWIAFRYASLDENTRQELTNNEAVMQWKAKVKASQHQIYAEDLNMLKAQQMRINQNAPAFDCPLKIDLLALRCRKWREERENSGTWFEKY